MLVGSIVVFAVAQVLAGLAPNIETLLASRALSGVAEGGVDIALVVLVADLLPDALRAKVYATFSLAWILPSLFGPGVAGAVAQWWGWRGAFLVPLLLLVPTVVALVPVLRAAPGRIEPRRGDDARSRLLASGVVAAAIGVLTWAAAAAASGTGWAWVAVLGALLGIGLRLRRVLPAGTLRAAPGAPAIVLVTLLVAFAFGAISAFLPLLLTEVRHEPPVIAGVSMTVTGIFWAVGANLASRDRIRQRWSAGRLAATGMALLALGGVGPALLAAGRIGLAPAMALFACCAVAIGMVSNTLSVRLVDAVAPEERGRYVSGRTVAAAVGVAGATTLGGALVARAADQLTGTPVLVTVLAGTVLAALTIPAAARV